MTALAFPLETEDGEVGVISQDIPQIQHTTDALERVNDVSQELMETDEEAILKTTPTLLETVLDVEFVELWRYDRDIGELRQHGQRADDVRYPEEFEDRLWETFVSGDLYVEHHVPPPPDATPSETPIRSSLTVPIGRHGVLCAGSTHPDRFDDTMVDLAEMVGVNVEADLIGQNGCKPCKPERTS